MNTTMNTTTQIELGQQIVINGDVRTIVSIKGRWVRLSDDSSISRTDAMAGRVEYLQDSATLGAELANPEEPEATPTIEQAFIAQVAADLGTTPEDADIKLTATGYVGPMLALRQRLQQGAYAKAANGQPCCGDEIAQALGALRPAQVIRACVIAMALPANPYTHLNIGQQSMNLRNKLRGCMKRGEFGMGVVVEAVEQVLEEDQA